MATLQVRLYSPLSPSPDDAPTRFPTAPASPSADDVKEHLADIQFTSHKCANIAQAILSKETKLLRSNTITPQGDPNDPNAADGSQPVRPFSHLPETVPVSELATIKGLLEDIWQATVPLSGSVFFLAPMSLLLRHRIHNITRDVSRYLEAVCAELQSRLGHDDEIATPLTPVSLGSDDDSNDDAFEKAPVESDSSESAPPSHVFLVLDVMLALLEASSAMLAAMSRFRSEHSIEETRERVSACLDRARFREHMYHPEDEGMSAAYAEADRLGVKSLQAHVSGLASYLWIDFGNSTL